MRFNTITYTQVIASAKLFLNLENSTDHDAFFLLMADEAMRQIDDRSMYEFRTENIPLDTGTAPLPCGFMQSMAVWFKGVNGYCTPAPYIERKIVDFCGCNTDNCGSLGTSYQINGNHIVFHNPEALDADEVTIAFLGIRLDENNQPAMYERHERAVRAYIMSRFEAKMSKAESVPSKRASLLQSSAISLREFVLQKKYLRGKAIVEGWKEDKASISRLYNAWIGSYERAV